MSRLSNTHTVGTVGARKARPKAKPNSKGGNKKRRAPRKNSRNRRRGQALAGFLSGLKELASTTLHSAFVAAVGAGLAYGVVALHHYATTSDDFAIHSIQVLGLERVTEASLLHRMALNPGMNIFDFDVERAAQRGAEDRWVREVQIARRLPDRLEVRAIEHQPTLLVALGPVYVVDEQGEIFKRLGLGEQLELPVLTGLSRKLFKEEPEHAAQIIETAMEIAADYGTHGPGKRVPLSELRFDESVSARVSATLFIGDEGIRVEVAGSDRNERRRQLSRLSALLRELERRGQSPRYVLLDHDKRKERATVLLAQR